MRGKSLVRTLALSVLFILLAAAPRAGAVESAGRSPVLLLKQILSGRAAVEALGDALPAVARTHRMTVERLKELLLKDRRLRVDRRGRLFYQDDYLPRSLPRVPAPAPQPAAYPLDRTFLLHSRPGATKVIYLDFDGYVLSGTAWNASYNQGRDIVCPPFDFEGGPSVFTDAEKVRIQNIWSRVAEDYAPFDVDVTTEDPGPGALTRSGSADQSYGVRAVISPVSSYFGAYGGLTYVGCFDDDTDYYKPSLIFSDRLYSDEKYVAEACSHELGHTFGLAHDGTRSGVEYYEGQGSGVTSWAPIMGIGYYANLTQWSRGEYPDANNTEDDLATIAGFTGYRMDDHGGLLSTATALSPATQLGATGIVGRSAEADIFSFRSGAGTGSITVRGASSSPNLDIVAEVLDGAGAVLANSNPSGSLDASLGLSLSAGTYYLRVAGAGFGTTSTGYSNYGCLGGYTVEGSVPSPSQAPVAVLTADPVRGELVSGGLRVSFDGSGSYDLDSGDGIRSYSWSFGDGQTAAGATVEHTYERGGTEYVATLVVTDAAGLQGSASVTIRVDDPQAGLVSHWTLDEGSGVEAEDSVSLAKGTVSGPLWVAGRIGSALRFEGGSDRLDLGRADLPWPWTAALWVKRDAATPGSTLFSSAAGALKLEQGGATYKVGLSRFDAGGADWAFNYTSPVGSWVHLAFVNTGAETRLYANGERVGALAQDLPLPLDRFGLGPDGLQPLIASLDDARVYDYALTDEEVRSLYREVPPDVGLPTVPADLSARNASCSQIDLTWSASADLESGVEGYNVRRDGVVVAHVLAPATGHSDIGLLASRSYSYAVSAVDNAGNESAWTPTVSQITPACPDATPPSPNPMTWASVPAWWSARSVTMRASTASDSSGVQYYFQCVGGGGHDSGWQAGSTYTDANLSPGVRYSYRVSARDLSSSRNQTSWSATGSATTPTTAKKVHVHSVAVSTVTSGRNYAGRATVYVYNELGRAVSGATVTGTFSGGFAGTLSAKTDSSGKAVLTSAYRGTAGAFTFCVGGITHPTLGYDPASNGSTCASR